MSAVRRADGFTLFELVLVVILLGILTAVAGPRITNIDPDPVDLRTEADRMAVVIRYAQHRAMNYEPTSFCVEEGRYFVVRGEDCTGAKLPLSGGEDERALPDSVTASSGVDWTFNHLGTFNRLGGLEGVSDPREITLDGRRGGSYTLTVHAETGYVEVNEVAP